jgi:anti-anti-sigma factor
MTHERPPVALVQLPEALNIQQERVFLKELEGCLSASRPRVVLDCSNLRQFDRAAIHLLLCCLEEALKRNGDVKLAAIPKEASAIFSSSGLDGLFEVFDTIAGAANSFRQVPKGATPPRDAPSSSHNNPANGA